MIYVMAKSKSALNIDSINRQLDQIADNFGINSVEFNDWIINNGIDSNFDLVKTKGGKVHIRNTAANRKKHQKLSSLKKKDAGRYIRQERKKYRSPKRKPGESLKEYRKRVKEKRREMAEHRYTQRRLAEKHADTKTDMNKKRDELTARDLSTMLNNSLEISKGVYQNNETGEIIDLAAIPNFNPDFLG